MDDEYTASTNVQRCAGVRCRREGSKLHWAPWNSLSSTLTACVGPSANDLEREDYSGQSDDIPWKSNGSKVPAPMDNEEEAYPSTEDNFDKKRATMPNYSVKPSRRSSLCEWRRSLDRHRSNLGSAQFSKDDTATAQSILTRLCSMHSMRKEDSERSSIARHSVDTTSWRDGAYLSSSPVSRRLYSLHFYGEYPEDSLSYTPIYDEEEKFDEPQKQCFVRPRRWISLLQQRFAKRVKVFEFDDRIGIFLIDNYY